MNLSKFEKILLVSVSIIVTVFSLYDATNNTFIGNSGTILQRTISVLSALASFTGVLATLLFQNRGKSAMIGAIINAILFGTFAFVMNLAADAVINIFGFIPLLIINSLYYSKSPREINLKDKKSFVILITLFIFSFTTLYFVVPVMNVGIGKIFDYSSEYGSTFKFYGVGRILDTLINTINVVAMVMMVKGLKGTGIVGMIKNISAVVFYSGVGFVNISIVIMNVSFIIISGYGIYKGGNEKGGNRMKKAIFVGQGAVGKSTIIKELKVLFKNRDLVVIDEREFLEDNETWMLYFGNMKKYAGKMQLEFLEFGTNEIIKLEESKHEITIMDRHVIETYMFGEMHMKMGNFSRKETVNGNKAVLESKNILSKLSKVDYVINIEAPLRVIEERIASRAKIEEGRETETNAPEAGGKLVNWGYYSDEYNFKGKYKNVAKKGVTYNNIDSKKTALEIYNLLK